MFIPNVSKLLFQDTIKFTKKLVGQKDLANRLKCSPTTIYRWEVGLQSPLTDNRQILYLQLVIYLVEILHLQQTSLLYASADNLVKMMDYLK